MAQSLAKIYVHLIFSTKDRSRTLPDDVRPDLHAYMGGTLKGLGCSPIEINSEPDHLHALFLLARTEALSDVVGHLKKSSNDWLRSRGPQFERFFWQAGFSRPFRPHRVVISPPRASACGLSPGLGSPGPLGRWIDRQVRCLFPRACRELTR